MNYYFELLILNMFTLHFSYIYRKVWNIMQAKQGVIFIKKAMNINVKLIIGNLIKHNIKN